MLRLFATVVALASALVLTPRRAAADPTDDAVEKITQLNKDALTAYGAKKYDDARKLLKQALDMASSAGLDNHPIKARTHVHMGVVIIVGFNQRDLGIKQFKKALEIQPDIALTKSLVTPDLTAAFGEAKSAGGATPATPPPTETPEAKPEAATPPPAAKPAAPPAEAPEASANGLTHEAISEGQQGTAISVTVEVSPDLQFDKLVLAYRPDGASEFLGREMKQVSDGQYGAEIPNTATGGSVVAYYIEAEDADGGAVANRGTVDQPLVIHLAGVGAARHHEAEGEEDEDEEEPDNRYYVGLMAGMGFGWATGNGDTNHDVSINPSGMALAGATQISPEFGYWWNSNLLLSVQIRYEVVTGTTDIYCQGMMNAPPGQCTDPTKVYHAANYALAGFARATWTFGEKELHPFFALAAGFGSIRHTVDFHRQNITNCGQMHNETCVDTIGGGPVLLGPGAGLMYEIGDHAALVGQLNSVIGFPSFTFNVDANVGVAVGF
jgi:hypothetical protein